MPSGFAVQEGTGMCSVYEKPQCLLDKKMRSKSSGRGSLLLFFSLLFFFLKVEPWWCRHFLLSISIIFISLKRSSGAAEFQSTQTKLLQLAFWGGMISGCVAVACISWDGKFRWCCGLGFSGWTDDTFLRLPASEVIQFNFFYWLTLRTVTFTELSSWQR